jgi:Uma2 family endonuclease
MLAVESKSSVAGGSPSRSLPLENGEFRHSHEFLRRYERVTQVRKAELIVEVAASSASIDLRDKRRACCRNGVREYLVWRVTEARLEWFCLED